MACCTRHGHGERTSRSVWCSHVGAPAREIKSEHIADGQRCWHVPGGKNQKTAHRISLSLDNRGPHKCSAGSAPWAAGGCSLSLNHAPWLVSFRTVPHPMPLPCPRLP